MKVTVAIPVYNGSKYIKETLNSLVKQSYDNYEIIVVDNCSTDNTVEIVKEFPQVGLIENQKNIGAEANFNKCFEVGEGELLALYHADDIYHPEILSEQVKCFFKKDIAVCGTLGKIIDENSNSTGKVYTLPGRCSDDYCVYNFQEIFQYVCDNGNDFLICPTMMFKRAAIKELGGFEYKKFRSSSDLGLWFKLALHQKLAVVNKQLINYRVHSQQGSQKLIRENQYMPDVLRVLKSFKPNFRGDFALYHRYTAFQLTIWQMRRLRAKNFSFISHINKLAWQNLLQAHLSEKKSIKYLILLTLVSIDRFVTKNKLTLLLYRMK